MHDSARGGPRESGMTLIELMLVVVIMGILASLAVPQFTSYIKKSKSVEATLALSKIAGAAVLYYENNTVQMQAAVPPLLPMTSIGKKPDPPPPPPGGSSGGSSGGAVIPVTVLVRQLPNSSSGYAPSVTHTTACSEGGGQFTASHAGDFNGEPWIALKFKPSGNFRYRYAWLLAQQATATQLAVGYAHALGDLDCNQTYSAWRVILREEQTGGSRSMVRTAPFLFQGRETD